MVVSLIEGHIVRAGGDAWAVVSHAHEDFRLSQRVELVNRLDINAVIQMNYRAGWDVYDAAYVARERKWLLTFSKDLRLQQTIALEISWERVQAFVKWRWDEDFRLTGLAYGEGLFMVIMSKGGVLEAEDKARLMRYGRFEEMKQALRRAWNQDNLMIGDLCFSDAYGWCASLTPRKRFVNYHVYELDGDLDASSSVIKRLHQRNEVVRTIAYGEKKWKVITAQYDSAVKDEDSVRATLQFRNSWDTAHASLEKFAEAESKKPSLGLCLKILQKVADRGYDLSKRGSLFEVAMKESVKADVVEDTFHSLRQDKGKKNCSIM